MTERCFNLVKKKTMILVLCLVITFTYLLPVTVYASDENNCTVVRVGYYTSNNFQEGASDSEVKSGYSYEYLRGIACYSGWKYEYVYGEWADLYEQFINGEIDIMAGMSKTEEREELMYFPQYEMGNESYYLYKHDNDSEITGSDLSTLSGKKIGGIKNNAMTSCLKAWAAENNLDLEIVEYDGFSERDAAFEKNEIAGSVSTDNNVSSESGRSAVAKIGEMPYYLAVTKKRPDLIRELNEALMKLNGVEPYFIQDLQYHYFGNTIISNTLTVEENNWIQMHPVLNVGYFENYMPYSGIDRDGNATGLLTDVVILQWCRLVLIWHLSEGMMMIRFRLLQ